jgi:hypothetical protein
MLAPGGGVAEATVAIEGAEVGEETELGVPFSGVATAETVCVTVVGGVIPVVWHTYLYDAPGAKLFPGTGTGPKQSLVVVGSELVTVMFVRGSLLVAPLVTTTRHQTSEPYAVADVDQ